MLSLNLDKMKRSIAFILLLFMFMLSAFAINTSESHAAANSASTTTNIFVDQTNGSNSNAGTSAAPYKTLYKAYSALKSTGGRIIIKGSAYTLSSSDNITLNDSSFKNTNGSYTVTMDSGCYVEIWSQSAYTGRMFDIPDGATLNLGSIIINGQNTADSYQLIRVNSGGTLNVTDATIKNNANCILGGGAIYNNGGTVKMSGGTITNCKVTKPADDTNSACGGAIYNSGGTLTITGGTITNCAAHHESTTCEDSGHHGYSYGGGIANVNRGTANITNLTVTNCSATSDYNGGYGYGGGLWSSVNCTMTVGGSNTLIDSNTADWDGGIATRGTFTLKNGTISNNSSGTSGRSGGGIGVMGEATITGGTITRNTSPYGSGIMHREGTITMTGGTISNNSTPTPGTGGGGGISMGGNSTFNMSGGTITGNTNVSGGGINNSGGTVNITGGKIYNNTATGSGGGIMNTNATNTTGTLTMTAGEIYSNTAATGSGVYQNATFKMSGTAKVNEDNDVYLTSDKYINVPSALTTDGTAAVITPNSYTLGRTCVTTYSTGSAELEHFTLSPSGTYYLAAGDTMDVSTVADTDIVIADSYEVVYKTNGTKVTGNAEAQTKEWGINLKLSTTSPSRPGYKFTGWNTASDGSGTSYTGGTTYSTEAPLTLYAQWTPYTLTINYYSNYADSCAGATVSSSSNTKILTKTLTYGVTYTDAVPDYTDPSDSYYMQKSGYTSSGEFNTKTDGSGYGITGGYSGKAQDIAEELNLDITSASASVNVYAQWTAKATAQASIINCTITNTYDYVNVEVNKIWEDSKNVYDTRPESITVNLTRNGTKIDSATLNETDSWGHTFEGLPKYDTSGNEYTYKVQEISVDGYTTAYDYTTEGNVVNCTITNTRLPSSSTMMVSGTKTWDDNNDASGIRPDSIEVGLVLDDEIIDVQTVTADDNWKYSFTGLDAGYDYSVVETIIPTGYEVSYNGYDITNTKVETVTINGTKTWDDNNDAAGLRPESITIEVLRDGDIIDFIEVTEDDNWQFSITLPKYKTGTTEAYVYTIEEETVYEYGATYSKSTSGDVITYNVTNTYAATPEILTSEISVTGEKVWDDDNDAKGKRPESVTIQLLRDNVVYATAEVTEDDNWEFEFAGLEEYKTETTKYTYDVVEANVDSNYTVSYSESTVNGYAHHTVTNTIKDDVPYTVTYDKNATGAIGSTADSTHYVDVAKDLTKNGYSLTGHKFTGWNTEKDGSGDSYSDQQEVVNLSTVANSVVTLYAQWDPIQYTIKYDGNGATGGSTADSTHVYNVHKNMTDNGYYRDGYVFTGWNSRADGKGTDYENLYDVYNWTTVDGTVYTVYAQWDPIQYTIKYDKNSSKATGTTEDSTHIYDKEGNMTKNGYSRKGYTFTGWNSAADGSGTAYIDENEVLNWTKENGKVFTVYAQWIANKDTTYVVNHWKQNIDGDKDSQDDKNYTLAETETLAGESDAKVTPEVKTYTGFTSPSPQEITIEADGTTVLNYYYTRNSYTVTTVAGTGITSTSGDGTYVYEAEVTINAEVTKGYTWSKWTGEYNTDIQKFTFTMPAKNVTQTATATANKYTVTYDGNGNNAGSTADSSHVFDVYKKLTKNGYTKIGYNFKNWNLDKDGKSTSYEDEQNVVNLTTEANGVVTMYAQWDPIKYTVTYHGNGATGGSTEDSIHYYDEAKNLTKNGYERTGYLFREWSSNENGTGETYADEQEVINLSRIDGAVIDMYAQWDPIKYTIKYDGNGATSGSTPDSDHIYDIKKNMSKNQYERTGYIFDGWNTEKDGSGDAYTDEQEVLNLTDKDGDVITVYAQWIPIKYTIKYDGNGATGGSTEDSHHTYDEPKPMTENGYTKTGYVFTGWNTEKDGSGDTYEDKAEVLNWTTKDGDVITVYAQWRPIEYTIVYDKNGATDGETPDSHHVYDEPGYISDNGYSRPGGTFLGWNTDPEGEGTWYEEGQEVINLTEIDGDVITLYAQWDVRGTLYITKRMKTDDYYEYHGDATFLFKVTSADDPDAVYYTEITFTKADIDSATGTLVSKIGEIDNLPIGEYIVEEVTVDRFDGGATYISNGTVSDNGNATFAVEDYVVEIDTIFVNEKTDWSKFTHNDMILNLLSRPE